MRNVLALIVLALGGASVQAFSIAVQNHSFEDPALNPGQFTYSSSGEVPGWSTTATGGADRGVWNTVVDGKVGDQIGFAYPNNSFAQNLSHSILANHVYTVSYLMGRVNPTTAGTVELWAGGTVANGVVTGGTLLASRTETFNGASGLHRFTFDWDSATDPSLVGEDLSVRIAHASGGYVNFDDIQIDAVPEPATFSLAALGLLALKRRRKN